VGGFWRRQRHTADDPRVRLRADAEFGRWRDACALAVDTLLASGQLTPAGTEFTGEMAQVLATWRAEPVSAEALAIAQRKADAHQERWRTDNG
jgi:hypothetical protein